MGDRVGGDLINGETSPTRWPAGCRACDDQSAVAHSTARPPPSMPQHVPDLEIHKGGAEEETIEEVQDT